VLKRSEGSAALVAAASAVDAPTRPKNERRLKELSVAVATPFSLDADDGSSLSAAF
jgi:hypothetical protein